MEKWSSKTGFLLAAIGSAVGIGNIWRFSAVVGKNGGGAYLIPYFLAVFAFAVPLMILEISMGRHLKSNVVDAFGKIKTKFRILGWIVVGVVFLCLSYYLVITGWALGYLLSALGNNWQPFSEFTSTYFPVLYFIIVACLIGYIVSYGVNKGIERITKILIPFSFVILIILVIYVTTLSGFGEGMNFFLTPDFSVLSNPIIWSAAFGQAFFSLSVGFGSLITYGSYLDKKISIPKSTIVITLADLSVAMMSGIVIFSIVFTFGLTPGMGSELAFSTLPAAFQAMAYGQILGIAFFLLFFVAAVTPSIAMMEVNVAAVMGKTKWSRKKTSMVVTIAILIFGLPSALSYSGANLSVLGLRVLDFMDDTIGSYGLPITALITAILFTWFIKKKILEEELGDSKLLAKIVYPVTKFLIPGVLIFTTSAKVALNYDIGATHFVPGVEFIGSISSGIGMIIIFGCLLGFAIFIFKYFNQGKIFPNIKYKEKNKGGE